MDWRGFVRLVALIGVGGMGSGIGLADRGRISGLAFGDVYRVPAHHDSSIQGRSGLRIRRINLTYDQTWGNQVSARIRLEGATPGNFRGDATLSQLIKDLFVQYTFADGTRALLGLIPTPSAAWIEETLGIRPIERVVPDLYRMVETRDQGVALRGAMTRKISYHAMIGSASGARGRHDRGLGVYGSLVFTLSPNLFAELVAESVRRGDKSTSRMVAGNLVLRNRRSTAAVSLAHNLRSGGNSATSTRLTVGSIYLDTQLDARNKPFLRVDFAADPIPGADRITYLAMANNGRPTVVIAGVDIKINESLHLIPNVEHVTYRSIGGSTSPKSDTHWRITFVWRF